MIRWHPKLVILTTRTDRYVGAWESLPARTIESRLGDWRARLTTTLGRLNGVGIPVLLVHPVPLLPQSPDRCAVASVLLGVCGSSVPLAVAEAQLEGVVAAEDAAAAASPLTGTLDPSAWICSRSACSTMRAHEVMYRDDDHLSVQGSLTLTNALARAVREQSLRALS